MAPGWICRLMDVFFFSLSFYIQMFFPSCTHQYQPLFTLITSAVAVTARKTTTTTVLSHGIPGACERTRMTPWRGRPGGSGPAAPWGLAPVASPAPTCPLNAFLPSLPQPIPTVNNILSLPLSSRPPSLPLPFFCLSLSTLHKERSH